MPFNPEFRIERQLIVSKLSNGAVEHALKCEGGVERHSRICSTQEIGPGRYVNFTGGHVQMLSAPNALHQTLHGCLCSAHGAVTVLTVGIRCARQSE